jgi:hypothetical protein
MTQAITYTAALDDSGFAATVARMRSTVQGMSAQIQGVGSQMAAAMGRTALAFGAVSAAAGVVGAAIKGVANRLDELDETAQSVGVTTEALSALRYAASFAGVNAEQLDQALVKLNVRLTDAAAGGKESAAVFEALGIRVKNSSGQMLGTDEALAQIADRFASYRDGAEKTALAVEIFGKAGAKLVPFLNQGAAGIERLKAEAEKLGLVIGGSATRAASTFSDNLDRLNAHWEGMKVGIGNKVIPALNTMIEQFQAANRASASLAETFRLLLGQSAQTLNDPGVKIRSLTDSLTQLQRRKAEIDAGGSGAGLGEIRDIDERIARMQRELAFLKELQRNRALAAYDPADYGNEGRGAAAPAAPTVRKPTAEAAPKKESAEPSMMAVHEAALAAEKLAFAQSNQLREMNKEQEIAYWRELIENYNVRGADRVAIQTKVANLELDVMRAAVKQQGALDEQALQAKQDRALGAVEVAQQEARGLYSVGQMSFEQLIELERQHEQQRTEIRREYLEARKAMIDRDRDPVAFQENALLIEDLERQHLMRMNQIKFEEQNKERDNPMKRVMDDAYQAMQTGIAKMIQGQQTLRQAMASIWASIRATIATEIAKIIMVKVAAWAKERMLALAGIGAKAAEAGAGAASSVASVPIAGPFLAIAALGAVMAAVLGAKSSVPSARFGFDIPAGVNPLTQLHEREMVLPAHIADPLREQLAGGGGGGMSVSLNVQAIDARSFRDYLRSHPAELADGIRAAVRDFHHVR